jgi:hypothetical protein
MYTYKYTNINCLYQCGINLLYEGANDNKMEGFLPVFLESKYVKRRGLKFRPKKTVSPLFDTVASKSVLS